MHKDTESPPGSGVDGTRTVLVVGGGLMGVGIAQVFACAGCEVSLVESDPERRRGAAGRLAAQLDLMVREKLLGRAAADAGARRVTVWSDLAAALGSTPQVVIEAVSEDLDLKRTLFAQLDTATPPSTLLCTNTSGLSITAIAEGLRNPERVCGAHFWNPPHLIPLVEVVRGAETADATVAAMVEILGDAGKTPVVVRKDVPGFVGNRLQHALQREAMALVASGVASAEEVDLVVTQGFGRRLGVVGPLAVCDLAGLDLVLQVDSYLMPDLADSPEPDPLLVRLVSSGEVGVRSLKGFLEWTPERVDAVVSARDAALIERLREDDRRARDPGSASRD